MIHCQFVAQAIQSYGGLVAIVVLALLYTLCMVPAGIVICCLRCCCACCKACGGKHREYDGKWSRLARRVFIGLLIANTFIITYVLKKKTSMNCNIL